MAEKKAAAKAAQEQVVKEVKEAAGAAEAEAPKAVKKTTRTRKTTAKADAAEKPAKKTTAKKATAKKAAEKAPAEKATAEKAPAKKTTRTRKTAAKKAEAPAANIENPVVTKIKEGAAPIIEKVKEDVKAAEPELEVVKEVPAAEVKEEAPAVEVKEEAPAAEAKEEAPAAEAKEEAPAVEEAKEETPAEEAAPAEPELPQPRRSIAFIGSECYPFVKTGGLGDVMYALPKALIKQNCDVKVILPRYKCIPQKYQEKMVYRGAFHMDLCADGRTYYVGIMEYVWDGVVYDFIDNEEFFSEGRPYTNLVDDIPKYCYFGKAALAALNYMDWIPDVIHCHDWQAGLVPVYLRTMFDNTPIARAKVMITIHNLSRPSGLCLQQGCAQAGL